MRLTLRTLLAWMDGLLPVEHADDLQDKVAASHVAQTLATRIKDVVHRPTLGAAAVSARSFAADANSTAEFLDNVLPSERIADFERVCIESDMQLAEVAACHRMLADMLAGRMTTEPLDPALRQRLLDAIAGRARPPAAAEPVAAGGPDQQVWGSVATATETWDTVLAKPDQIPRPAVTPSRRSAGSTWAIGISAAVLLAGLFVALGWILGRSGSREVAVRNPPPPVAPPQPERAAAADASPPPAPALKPAEPQPAEPKPVESKPPEAAQPSPPPSPPVVAPPAAASPPPPAVVAPAQPEPAPGPATPAPAVPEPPAAAPVAVAPRVPQGDALAIAAPASPPVAPPPAPATPVQPAPVQPPKSTVLGEFALLRAVAGEPPADGGVAPLRWLAARAGDEIQLPWDVVAPPFSQPELEIDGLRIRLLGDTRAVIIRDRDGTPRLDILFGRAVVKGDGQATRLGVTAGGLVGVVTRGLGAPLGIDVALERPPGGDPAAAATVTTARIMSAGDGFTFLQTEADGGPPPTPLAGILPELPVEARKAVTWTSRDEVTARTEPLDPVPGWLSSIDQADAPYRSAAAALATRLPRDQPVQPALRELATDPRGETRVTAAATLALLGEYDELVRQLCAEARGRELYDGQWAKLESLAVPLALARGERAAARLGQAFLDHAPVGSGADLARLARGFSAEELASGDDAWLVERLESPSLAVRRFAIQNLLAITAPSPVDRLRYRPDGRPEQRRAGVEWWREQQSAGRIRPAAGRAP